MYVFSFMLTTAYNYDVEGCPGRIIGLTARVVAGGIDMDPGNKSVIF